MKRATHSPPKRKNSIAKAQKTLGTRLEVVWFLCPHDCLPARRLYVHMTICLHARIIGLHFPSNLFCLKMLTCMSGEAGQWHDRVLVYDRNYVKVVRPFVVPKPEKLNPGIQI